MADPAGGRRSRTVASPRYLPDSPGSKTTVACTPTAGWATSGVPDLRGRHLQRPDDHGGRRGGRHAHEDRDLYLDVIQSLTRAATTPTWAGARPGLPGPAGGRDRGFTAATAPNVHKATLATRLRTTPTQAPQGTADAPATCPGVREGEAVRQRQVLPEWSCSPKGSTWLRAPTAASDSNATSGLVLGPPRSLAPPRPALSQAAAGTPPRREERATCGSGAGTCSSTLRRPSTTEGPSRSTTSARPRDLWPPRVCRG